MALPAANKGETMRVKFSKRTQELVVTFPGATPKALCESSALSSRAFHPTPGCNQGGLTSCPHSG